jgi:hypothetical protein
VIRSCRAPASFAPTAIAGRSTGASPQAAGRPTQDPRKGTPAREERRAISEAAASDEQSIDQLVQAAVGTHALLSKLNDVEARLQRMKGPRGERLGNGVAALSTSSL